MPKATKENELQKDKINKKENTTKQVKKAINTIENKQVISKKSATKSTVNANSLSADTKKKVSSKTTKEVPHVSVMEYYDLPYRYNQTIVKILAQTPQMLFVYWDISDEDRNLLINQYGDDFFSKTKPVLLVHNQTMNYCFEIEINDFANSWYLHVNDANCTYKIELGRRPNIISTDIQNDYIHITNSNELNSPNNHILFKKFDPNVQFTNIKTGESSNKDFSNLSDYKNIKQIYHIYDLYKHIYKDEIFEEVLHTNLNNPSSGASSPSK